jgi:two-component system LytT family response regulator
MPIFRVLTVDGEASARHRLHSLLAHDPECALTGECANGVDAIRSLGRAQPDIVFVDARTPEMDGFGVSCAVSGLAPLVILTSSHSERSLGALETQVFDYLSKPIEPARFHNSLGRAKAEIARDSARARGNRFVALVESLLRLRQSPRRIAVRRGGRVLFITLDEIDWIEAADNYVCLHCGSETHMLRETMSEVEARLEPARFTRIHRSAIVNVERIKELQPWFRGDYRVILRDGTTLTLTKRHRANLDSQLLLGSFARGGVD